MPVKQNKKPLEKIGLREKLKDNYSIKMYKVLGNKKINLESKRSLKNHANHVILANRIKHKLQILDKKQINFGLSVVDKLYTKLFSSTLLTSIEKYEKIIVSLAKEINRKEGKDVYFVLEKYNKLI
jgi:hypothetical protein